MRETGEDALQLPLTVSVTLSCSNNNVWGRLASRSVRGRATHHRGVVSSSPIWAVEVTLSRDALVALPSAQVMIPGSWDGVPRSGSLHGGDPASPSAAAPPPCLCALTLCQINK